MKQNILKIEQLAALLFADKKYNEFIKKIERNKINEARLMIDIEIERYDSNSHVNSNFKHATANKLQDLVMDLIINEIDGERENKQVKSNTR